MDSIPLVGRVKPKTVILIFAASLLKIILTDLDKNVDIKFNAHDTFLE